MKKWFEVKIKVLDFYLVLKVLNVLNNLKIKSEDIKIIQVHNCITIYFLGTEQDNFNADKATKDLKI